MTSPTGPAADSPTGRTKDIVEAALRLLETEGPAALTMRRVAARLGIKSPSLYKHVTDKDVIVGLLQQHAMHEFGTHVAAAGPDPRAVAAAYRSWAIAHPHLYELATRRPVQRGIVGSTEGFAGAPLAAAVGGDPDRMRAFLGLAHGLVDLELNGHFGAEVDLEGAWRVAVDALARPKRRRPRDSPGPSALASTERTADASASHRPREGLVRRRG